MWSFPLRFHIVIFKFHLILTCSEGVLIVGYEGLASHSRFDCKILKVLFLLFSCFRQINEDIRLAVLVVENLHLFWIDSKLLSNLIMECRLLLHSIYLSFRIALPEAALGDTLL